MAHHLPVPRLKVQHVAGLEEFDHVLLTHQIEIEQWFRQQWLKYEAPFYASVDLRNAGFKLAPIDTNLFPAGFNNLNPAFDVLAVQAMQAFLQQRFPGCSRILLIPENHTRNNFYFANIARLMRMLSLAGYDVRCGSLREEMAEPTQVDISQAAPLTIYPVRRTQDKIHLDSFSPCIILLNNDLSEGIPAILNHIQQPVFPSPQLGWSSRKKSQHFSFYNAVADEFSKLIGIDPWRINPFFEVVGDLDFVHRKNDEALADKINSVLKKTQAKYQEYHIKEKPFVIVKADSGTYGMGVIRVHDAQEILELNRKQRTKMASTKGHQPITQVMVQEGVPSFEFLGRPPAVAEPVVYMIHHYVVGGFYRVHSDKSSQDILNTPGMHFEPLAFAEPCSTPQCDGDPLAPVNRFYAYGVTARLALLAAAMEMQSVKGGV